MPALSIASRRSSCIRCRVSLVAAKHRGACVARLDVSNKGQKWISDSSFSRVEDLAVNFIASRGLLSLINTRRSPS